MGEKNIAKLPTFTGRLCCLQNLWWSGFCSGSDGDVSTDLGERFPRNSPCGFLQFYFLLIHSSSILTHFHVGKGSQSQGYTVHTYIYIYTYTCYAITYIQLPNSLPPPLKKPKANQSTTLVLYNTFCQTGLPWCDATLGFPNCPNRLRSTKVTWR